MKLRAFVFHPAVVLICSLLAAATYAARVTLHNPEAPPFDLLFYVVPIIVPFVAFLFDRAESPRKLSVISIAIDVLIVVIAMARAGGHVPLVSGHSLFLTHALLSTDSYVARISASVVMIQVIFLKIFLWHDVVSLAGGIALGALAAMFARRYVAKAKAEQSKVVPPDHIRSSD